jgi:hypothetical protein
LQLDNIDSFHHGTFCIIDYILGHKTSLTKTKINQVFWLRPITPAVSRERSVGVWLKASLRKKEKEGDSSSLSVSQA